MTRDSRSARHELEAIQKEGDLSGDELERVEKEIEKVTHQQVAAVEQLLSHKEKELLEV